MVRNFRQKDQNFFTFIYPKRLMDLFLKRFVKLINSAISTDQHYSFLPKSQKLPGIGVPIVTDSEASVRVLADKNG